MNKKFPKDFMWGSAMSALQSEGVGITKAGKSAYDASYSEKPEKFFGQTTPYTGVDSQRHFREDLKMMAEFGHNSFRNSFSWARLFPDGKKPDPKAVAYYHEFLAEAKKNGMKRIMTLMHFDTPAWFQKGFLDPKYPAAFAEYAKFVFEEFKDDVEVFATYNEPNIHLLISYALGESWPFISDLNSYFKAGAVMAYSHALAVNHFNAKMRTRSKAKISFVHAVSPVIAKDGIKFSKEDEEATRDMSVMFNYLFLDLMINGKITPEIKSTCSKFNIDLCLTKEMEEAISKVKLDMLGVNYYSPMRAMAPSKDAKTGMEKLAGRYSWPKARMNPFRSWEIFPEGLKMNAQLLQKRYGNIPYWIGENGMGVQEEWRYLDKDGEIDDQYRIAFISEHLNALWEAIQDGSKCVGYHVWSTYDCWSMMNGYKNTYGLIRVDLNTMRRSPKKSARWFKGIAERNELPPVFKKVEETIDFSKIKAIQSVSLGAEKRS